MLMEKWYLIEMGDNTTESNIQGENINPVQTYDFYSKNSLFNGSVKRVVLFFTTPPLGDICDDPIIIEGLPFNVQTIQKLSRFL